jgi:hypothetical protein
MIQRIKKDDKGNWIVTVNMDYKDGELVVKEKLK